MKKVLIFALLLLLGGELFSQTSRAYVRQGNKDYEEGKIDEAGIAYRESLQGKDKLPEAVYNLGNTLYKQQNYVKAAEQYETYVTYGDVDAKNKAAAYHNLGNSYLQQQAYDKSVHAYKEALKLNPEDNETRYNLALAQSLLARQQNPQQYQEQEKNVQEQEQKEELEQRELKQINQDQISDENMEQIMKAISQEEILVREKAQKQKQQNQRKRVDKDW